MYLKAKLQHIGAINNEKVIIKAFFLFTGGIDDVNKNPVERNQNL